jgi:hypothetical protein
MENRRCRSETSNISFCKNSCHLNEWYFSEGLVECKMLFHVACQVSGEAAASDV